MTCGVQLGRRGAAHQELAHPRPGGRQRRSPRAPMAALGSGAHLRRGRRFVRHAARSERPNLGTFAFCAAGSESIGRQCSSHGCGRTRRRQPSRSAGSRPDGRFAASAVPVTTQRPDEASTQVEADTAEQTPGAATAGTEALVERCREVNAGARGRPSAVLAACRPAIEAEPPGGRYPGDGWPARRSISAARPRRGIGREGPCGSTAIWPTPTSSWAGRNKRWKTCRGQGCLQEISGTCSHGSPRRRAARDFGEPVAAEGV